MAYTPQQNGVVERKHRHLLDTARATRLHANLPIKFWGDSFLTATYLINKMPMEILEWKYPYEKMFGQPLVYDHFRVIECLCYAAATVSQKDKFDNKGIKCVLLGYPMNQKDEFYPETTQTPIPPDLALEPDNENSGNENSDSSYNSTLQNVNHIPPEPTRRSTSQSPRPVWLKDFVAPTGTKSGLHYPLFASIDFLDIPQQHIAFLANVLPQPKPTRYQQAIQHPGWVEEMNKELKDLKKNTTRTLTKLPSGHKAITSKWVYKTKFKPIGIIERLKARLVDYSLFVKVQGDSFTAALVYADIVLITGNTAIEIDSLKKSLDDKFTIKDLGLAKYFLGIAICHTSTGTHLNQRKYILDHLTDASLTAAKPNLSHLPTNLKLTLNKGVPFSDPAAYRRLVGRLLYLRMTRPDISYVVQHLSQFVSSPKDVHLSAAIHLLKYFKGNASKGMFYPIQPHLQVTGFTDADWASCLMTRKSLTGYCILLGHSLVFWKTKKQAIVSRSSTEAEYRSMSTTTCELLWLSFLLKDLHIPVKLPITLFCDNKSAQQIAANPCFHERTKHMDIDSHFTRENVHDCFLQTAFIPSHLQLADIMTKALNSVQHSFLAAKLGISTAPT
nr:hypothetical protein [Tanacetum cinerariifolium]